MFGEGFEVFEDRIVVKRYLKDGLVNIAMEVLRRMLEISMMFRLGSRI